MGQASGFSVGKALSQDSAKEIQLGPRIRMLENMPAKNLRFNHEGEW
jgi:hypothetical protein